jgi:hypothetical protein
MANGNQNGAPVADPANGATFTDLDNQDVTTPGFIRLPVCSPDMAFAAWSQSDGPSTEVANYPCIPPQLLGYCDTSDFVDKTSAASPLVSDCQALIRKIQARAPADRVDHEVENGFGQQHEIEKEGTCIFGVQAIGKDGNIDFHVGGQDIVDIITTSIEKFGGSGRVGASGSMLCKGTVKSQWVEWGLY